MGGISDCRAKAAAGEEVITSTSNSLVKHLVKLRDNRSYREQTKRVLLVGRIPILETLNPPNPSKSPPPPLHTLVVSKGYVDQVREFNPQRRVVADARVLEKIAGVNSGDSLMLAAEVGIPPMPDLKSRKVQRLLVLDGVQDPGNLGTLIRTALGLGWDAAYLLRGTCDPWNSKAIRAARGGCFRLPIVMGGSIDDLRELIDIHKLTVVAADPHAAETVDSAQISGPVALWLGSEGKGLTGGEYGDAGAETIVQGTNEVGRALETVKIDMESEMESLNVAVAGAILMHIFRRRLE
uniref:tRNA/rRNA methyltransferase SpoU type domain-containing protein n=1 Tax=Amorphochlora amoebiformis TaxID=1561963 RepID=A0A7S0DQR4_9EUKA